MREPEPSRARLHLHARCAFLFSLDFTIHSPLRWPLWRATERTDCPRMKLAASHNKAISFQSAHEEVLELLLLVYDAIVVGVAAVVCRATTTTTTTTTTTATTLPQHLGDFLLQLLLFVGLEHARDGRLFAVSLARRDLDLGGGARQDRRPRCCCCCWVRRRTQRLGGAAVQRRRKSGGGSVLDAEPCPETSANASSRRRLVHVAEPAVQHRAVFVAARRRR